MKPINYCLFGQRPRGASVNCLLERGSGLYSYLIKPATVTLNWYLSLVIGTNSLLQNNVGLTLGGNHGYDLYILNVSRSLSC